MIRMNQEGDQVCTCNHSRRSHVVGQFECWYDGCECRKFTPDMILNIFDDDAGAKLPRRRNPKKGR